MARNALIGAGVAGVAALALLLRQQQESGEQYANLRDAYQNQVSDLQSDYESNVGTLSERIQKLNSKIDSLESTASMNQKRFLNQNERLTSTRELIKANNERWSQLQAGAGTEVSEAFEDDLSSPGGFSSTVDNEDVMGGGNPTVADWILEGSGGGGGDVSYDDLSGSNDPDAFGGNHVI